MQKSARFTDEDLHKAGYTIVGNEVVPLGAAEPDASWDEDRLAAYAKGELANSREAESQAILQAHKSAIHLFRAGHALALVRAKCKAQGHGAWKRAMEQHGLAHTTVNDAIRLYENAKTEDALAGMGITEAKEKYVYPVKTTSADKPDDADDLTEEEKAILDGPVVGLGTTPDAKDEEQEAHNDTVLGTLAIGPGAVAKVEADAFRSVSAVDRERKLLVCGRWDRRAKEAVERGIAVLVLPELQEGYCP